MTLPGGRSHRHTRPPEGTRRLLLPPARHSGGGRRRLRSPTPTLVRGSAQCATITAVTMIVISESDGNAIGVFHDAPIPRTGDLISVEGTIFSPS
jgi:hypothetical protein